jgi:enamine deaminase RidA (YjgF/YER057c/UK114 family)
VIAALTIGVMLVAGACTTPNSARKSTMKGHVEYLSPDGLHKNPAFSQAVVVSGRTKTVYVGGQNAVSADGKIVGKADLGKQAEQVIQNLQTALAAGGAKLEHVVKWTVYMVQGQPPGPGFAVFQRAWGQRPNPPLISVVFVSGLANPDFLMEVEAVAVVPEEQP